MQVIFEANHLSLLLLQYFAVGVSCKTWTTVLIYTTGQFIRQTQESALVGETSNWISQPNVGINCTLV